MTNKYKWLWRWPVLSAVLWLVSAGCAWATGKTDAELDALVERARQTFNVPGVAVAVVHEGRVEHVKAYGIRDIESQQAVDTQTLFKIASLSKAFNSAALATLVDAGKLDFNAPVRAYLPDFTLYDPWVTEQFTLVDMLTHRSGLGLGAGDLMLWPEPSGFRRSEVVHNLRYLPGDKTQFRTKYAYDNLLYIAAGQVLEAVSGQSWESYVEQQLMRPLGMQHCVAGDIPTELQNNVATPHKMVEGKLARVLRETAPGPSVSAPAGGIRCSIADMAKWTQMWLGQGKALLSAQVKQQLWQPYTLMSVSEREQQQDNTHFAAYALGWRLHDYHGTLRVHHTGALAGMRAHLSLFPEKQLGIVVLINQGSSNARQAIMQTLANAYLDAPQQDWIAYYRNKELARDSNTSAQRESVDASFPLTTAQEYLGDYQDNWFGDVSVTSEQGKLIWQSAKMSRLRAELQPVAQDKFYAYWYDRSMHADSWVIFTRDEQGRIKGMQMVPFDDIDWSFDFQDLDLRKVNKSAAN